MQSGLQQNKTEETRGRMYVCMNRKRKKKENSIPVHTIEAAEIQMKEKSLDTHRQSDDNNNNSAKILSITKKKKKYPHENPSSTIRTKATEREKTNIDIWRYHSHPYIRVHPSCDICRRDGRKKYLSEDQTRLKKF